ncbi:putative efflux pump antibiotic resistance protein [Xylariomycetidae sp. FL2044]|nr:putative efflux pump antibiotic resistance protein [Xylariomycetidae sp. FL2044]
MSQQSHSDGGGESEVPPVAARKAKGIFWAVVMVSLISSTFLYALDNTTLATVRPSMIETFGRIDLLTWLSIAYPMAEVGSNPLWGKLNTQFDNKALYLIALATFEVGSAIIGSAPVIEAVIVGRVLAGMGGSGIYVGTMNIVSAMTLPSERTTYLNQVGFAWALGAVLGPVVGGAFADSPATWRWAFYINVVIGAVAAPACIFLIPAVVPPNTDSTLWQRIKKIDYVGAVLFFGGVCCVVSILGFGGVTYSWNSGEMIGLYVAAVVAWTAFSLQQRFSLFTVDRIFPLHLVAYGEMVILFCWTAIGIANVTVTIYSLPLLFQFAYGDSPLNAGVWTLPFIGTIFAISAPLGPLFPKYPIYIVWYLALSVLLMISGGLMSTIDYSTPRAVICGYTVIQGVGCAPIIQLGFTVGQSKMGRSAVGQVSGFMTCAQMGVATTVFINLATEEIAGILPDLPRDIIRAAINGVGSAVFDDLEPELRRGVVEIVARNIGKIFYLNLSGAVFGFLIALLLKRERLNLNN